MSDLIANRPIHSKETHVTSLENSGSFVSMSKEEIEEKYSILKMQMEENNYIELIKAEDISKCFGNDYQQMINIRTFKHIHFFVHKYSIFFNLIFTKEHKELLEFFKRNKAYAALVLQEANANKLFTLAITFRTRPDGTRQHLIADKSGKFPVWFASKEDFENSGWNKNFNSKKDRGTTFINGVVFIKDEGTGFSRQAKIDATIEDIPFYFLKEFKNMIDNQQPVITTQDINISEITRKIKDELYSEIEAKIRAELEEKYKPKNDILTVEKSEENEINKLIDNQKEESKTTPIKENKKK